MGCDIEHSMEQLPRKKRPQVKRNIDYIAEDAVSCELFSAQFPANREKYWEYGQYIGSP